MRVPQVCVPYSRIRMGCIAEHPGNVILPVTMKGSLVIPQATTFEIQDITYVYKVVDGKAQSAPVSVTRVNGGQEYIVNDGLKEGDIIVAEGVICCVKVLPLRVKQN